MRQGSTETIKKVSVDVLRPGMFIHDLNCGWMDHSFVRGKFLIRTEREVQKIREIRVREVYIDTVRGEDVADAPTHHEVQRDLDSQILEAMRARPAAPPPSAGDELNRARLVHQEATKVIRNVLHDARLGVQIRLEQLDPVVERVTSTILRNSGALLSLCRMKNKDDYTFQHSISVCALMVSFARSVGMSADEVRLAGIGGMLHDVGKVLVPDEILNKPGKLTDEEFAVMKAHPGESRRILSLTPGMPHSALLIATEHHERFDGSGYPNGLKGDQISRIGQMAAICDVYDAITSDRCYHKGMTPTEALRKIFEWSKFHFNPELVHAFLRCIGIYPVGTLVMLESGRLAVVTETREGNLVQPKVRVVFDAKRGYYVQPEDIDLSKNLGRGGADRIVSQEAPEKWKIDPLRFL